MVCRTVIPSAPLRDSAQPADPSWPLAPLYLLSPVAAHPRQGSNVVHSCCVSPPGRPTGCGLAPRRGLHSLAASRRLPPTRAPPASWIQ
eukprot:3439698-Pyramimonas_sp.AAC.1